MIELAILILGQGGRADTAPALSTQAPKVVARMLGSEADFDMASNKGKLPTVLIFGSCT